MTENTKPLEIGKVYDCLITATHVWGAEVYIPEIDRNGAIDILYMSDDPDEMNQSRFPQPGETVRAKAQGMSGNGELRLTRRQSDLARAQGNTQGD